MSFASQLKDMLRAGRKRRSSWIRALDLMRVAATAQGRSILWTRFRHGGQVHQTTTFTGEDRYPALFDLAAKLAPEAKRILSFGCSTGEELSALRRRFPDAEIVGAEINARARRIATRRVAADRRITVVRPQFLQGQYDLVFALAVLQREPHRIAAMEVEDLSSHYPFRRFDNAVRQLAGMLRDGGLLCVANAHYRIEDSSMAPELTPIAGAPIAEEWLFARDGRRLGDARASTMFRKRHRSAQ